MAAIMLIAIGLVFYVTHPTAWLQADYHTKMGEVQQLALPDGTTAHLNTHSAIALHFGERERRVEVLYGETAFTVAREKSRPFIVETLNVQAHALGTCFTVRVDQGQVQVTVLRHQVVVSTRGGFPGVILHRGQTIRCAASSSCGPITTVDVNATTAWQRGKLIFDRVPLSTVVAELLRYRRGFIVIISDELAQRTVSGVFRLDELDVAVDTIITELKMEAIRLPFVTLLY
jgi:transmembrane sensor